MGEPGDRVLEGTQEPTEVDTPKTTKSKGKKDAPPIWYDDNQPDVRDTDWFDQHAGVVPYSYIYDKPKVKVTSAQKDFMDALMVADYLTEDDAPLEIVAMQGYLKGGLSFQQAAATVVFDVMHKTPEYEAVLEKDRGQLERSRKNRGPKDEANFEAQKTLYKHTGGKYAKAAMRFIDNMGEGVAPFIESIKAYEQRKLATAEATARPPSERYQITSHTYRLQKAQENLEKNRKPTYLDKVIDKVAKVYNEALGGGKPQTIPAVDVEGNPLLKRNKDGDVIISKKTGKPIQQTKKIYPSPNKDKAIKIKGLQAKIREIVNNEDVRRVTPEQKKALDAVIKELESLPLVIDAVDAFNIESHPNVVQNLKDGELRRALIALQLTTAVDEKMNVTGTNWNVLRDTAKKFANMIGDTKVEVVENLISPKTGNRVSGLYDPKTDTISIDAEYANSPHVLLHETAHALTLAAIKEGKSSVVKKLQKIYDSTKDELSTYYGTTDLAEFVAEFHANPKFQRELNQLVDNQGVSVWQRIKDALSYFFFGTQPEKASENLSKMMDALLAPAPEYMNAEVVNFGEDIVSRFDRKYGQWHKDIERPSLKNVTETAKELLSRDSVKTAKRITWWALPSQALADVIGWYDKKAGEITYNIHDLLLKQQGALGESDQQLDAFLNELRAFAKANPERMELFDRFSHEASFVEYHPDPQGNFAKYKDRMKKKYKDNPRDQAKFDELAKQWRQLGVDGQKMYWKLLNTYSDIFDNMQLALEGKMDTFDPSEAKKLKNRLAKELFDKERIFPYVPFFRKGDYWLSFDTKDSAEPQIMAFEKEFQRDQFVERLEADPNVPNESIVRLPPVGDLTKKGGWDKAPAQSFVAEILKIMDANMAEVTDAASLKAHEDEKEQVVRLFIAMLPETSFAKSLQRRENKLGYKEDTIAAFRGKAYDMARQVVQVEYSTLLYRQQKELAEYLNEFKAREPSNKFFQAGNSQLFEEEIAKRISFAVNPPNNIMARFVRGANRLAFLGTIGFNVSSAVVNLSQLPMVVLPYLAGTTDWSTASKNLYKASRLHYGAGHKYKVSGYGKNSTTQREIHSYGHSIGNWYQADSDGKMVLREDADMTAEQRRDLKEIQPLIQFMHDRGILNRSLFYDTAGVETSGKGKDIFDYVAAGSAFFFHNTERFNRETAMIAAYLNERARQDKGNLRSEEKGLSDAELKARAIENAVYIGHQTNGGATLTTAPRISQQGIMRIAMMYKTYGIQMYYNQFKLLREAYFSKLPKEMRKEAERQFWNTQAAVLALSGVSGLTIVGIIEALMDIAGDDDDLPGAARIQNAIGTEFYKGGLNYLSRAFGGEGIDFSSRIGLSHLLMQTNRYDFDPSLEKDIIRYLGGPFYGYTSQMMRGFKDLGEGEYRRGVENILPAAFRNVSKAERFYFDGPLTRRHDPITGDIGPALALGQMFGFAPYEYVRNQERNMALKGIDRATNEKRSKLLKEYYLALRVGGPSELLLVREDMRRFNERWPQYKIDSASIERSMKQHRETSRNMYNGVLFSPKLRRELEMLGEEVW